MAAVKKDEIEKKGVSLRGGSMVFNERMEESYWKDYEEMKLNVFPYYTTSLS